jgi:hypothetical protein
MPLECGDIAEEIIGKVEPGISQEVKGRSKDC